MNQSEETEAPAVSGREASREQEAAVVTPPAPRRGGGALAGLALLIAIAAVGAFLWLWQQQQDLAQRVSAIPQPSPAADPTQLASLQDQVQGLQKQLGEVSKAIAGAPSQSNAVDLKPLEERIAKLESQQPASAGPAPDLGSLQDKIASVAADAQAAKSAVAKTADQLTAVQQQLQATQQKLETAQQAAEASSGKAVQAQALARAQVALSSGQPLGPIPGAPSALTRFATTAPPTEAQLRLSFPAAAAAAEKASQPATAGESFGARVLHNAEALITVKQGDRVIVGSPASQVLGEAHARLNAGDLAGAIRELDALDPSAAQAMSGWRDQAQSLLDARAALAQMARA
jgi:hypothetical protein